MRSCVTQRAIIFELFEIRFFSYDSVHCVSLHIAMTWAVLILVPQQKT